MCMIRSMTFTFEDVDLKEVEESIRKAPARGRTSAGGELVNEFLASGKDAARVPFGTEQDRNKIVTSANNFIRGANLDVWVRKDGKNALMLINLDKASKEIRDAYANRPRPGRKPGSTNKKK